MGMQRITLRQLELVEILAREGSFSRAARVAHLTQPAISMQIKRLEEEIGLPLFDRQGRQLMLTEAGEEMLQCAQQIREQLCQTNERLDAMRGLEGGRLHLTMAATANYFAPQLIAAFHRQYPKVEIRLSATNRAGLLHALDDHATDMAIMGAPPDGHQLRGHPFMSNPLVIIAHPAHPLAGERNIPLRRLADVHFIVREAGSGTRRAAEHFFERHGLKLRAGAAMNRVEAIKQAVMSELGLGIVSLHTLEMELQLQRLVVLDVEDFPILRQWYIVHREGKRFTPVQQAFLDFVLRYAASLIQTPSYPR